MSITAEDVASITKAVVAAMLKTDKAESSTKTTTEASSGARPRPDEKSVLTPEEKAMLDEDRIRRGIADPVLADTSNLTTREKIMVGLRRSNRVKTSYGAPESTAQPPAFSTGSTAETAGVTTGPLAQTVDRRNQPTAMQNIREGLRKSKPAHGLPDRYL